MTRAKNHSGISPAMVQSYLAGISYPAAKADLIAKARSNNAPENVLKVIGDFSLDDYGGPQDVLKAYGKLDRKVPAPEQGRAPPARRKRASQ
jgi:hypothetical protein